MNGRGRGTTVKEGPLREELKRFRCCALFPIPGRGMTTRKTEDKNSQRQPASPDKGISPGHFLIGRSQTDIPSLRPQSAGGIDYAVAAGLAQLELSRHDEDRAARPMSGAAASAGPYSSQQHGGQQGFGESYGARRESGDASANLGAPSQRAPPAQQQQHHQPRPSLPPDALSSQTILHPRKPARSYSGPVPLDPVDARSSPSGAADIRPHTPEETTGRRAPSSGPEPRNGDSFPGPFPPDFPPSHPYAHASPEQQQALDELRRQSILPGAAACAGWDEALSPSSRVQQRLAVPPAQLDPQALTLATELRKEGVRLMQLNQNAAADIVFTEGLRCNPGDAQMLSSRVTCRSRLGRHADAMMDAFAVTQLVPDWHRGHFQVGVAMEAQGRYEEAAAAFDRAVSLARLTACEQGVLREYMRRLDRVRWLSRGHTEVLRSVERIMKKAGQKPPTALAAAAGGAASPAR